MMSRQVAKNKAGIEDEGREKKEIRPTCIARA